MINEMSRIYQATVTDECTWKFNEVESCIYYERGTGYVFRIMPRRHDGLGYEYVYGWGWTGGYKVLVLACNRQSKKRYEEAASYINRLEDEFIAKLEEASGGKLKVARYAFEQTERDRYAA